jgi:hypothetical protein
MDGADSDCRNRAGALSEKAAFKRASFETAQKDCVTIMSPRPPEQLHASALENLELNTRFLSRE